jgi:hypothetical protein
MQYTALFALVAALPQSPRALEIAEDVACAPCRIVVRGIGPVGGKQPLTFDPEFNAITAVAVDARGRLMVGPTHDGFAVFDIRAQRTRNVAMDGPSRHGGIAHIRATVGDSLLVVDIDNWLVSVLSPRYEYVRSLRMPGFSEDFLPLPDGSMLSNIVSRDVDLAGVPLFRTTSAGTLAEAFGADSFVFTQAHTNVVRRRLGTAMAGFFWAAHRDRYEIELWSSSVQHIRTIRRRVSWFPPGTRDQLLVADEGRPGTRIESVEQDSVGRLFVVISTAVAGWQPTFWQGQDRPSERPVPPHATLHPFFDTILEVIDPAAGTVLASERTTGRLLPVRGSARYLYSWRALPSGRQVIDLWEVSLIAGES